ncbi:MAG: hypothetical protein AVDCRST_MAG01-01-3640, partial [uncultured Rubrobacteraceae bacterium]
CTRPFCGTLTGTRSSPAGPRASRTTSWRSSSVRYATRTGAGPRKPGACWRSGSQS